MTAAQQSQGPDSSQQAAAMNRPSGGAGGKDLAARAAHVAHTAPGHLAGAGFNLLVMPTLDKAINPIVTSLGKSLADQTTKVGSSIISKIIKLVFPRF